MADVANGPSVQPLQNLWHQESQGAGPTAVSRILWIFCCLWYLSDASARHKVHKRMQRGATCCLDL